MIVESVLTKEYNVSNYLNNAMVIRCSNEFKVPEANVNNSKKASFCYICNGYYNDTLSRINQVLDQGSFNIGISSSKHKSFYKLWLKNQKYHCLKNYFSRLFSPPLAGKTRIFLFLHNFYIVLF